MASPSNVGALHRNLLSALGTGIASGTHQAGQVLTLESVSSEHGVSRSVAREAIRVLESMGMVVSRRRVGITIQPSENGMCSTQGSFAGGSNPMTGQRFW